MIKLKLNWKYCIAFYCVTMLYMSLHELVHHFVAAAVCGEIGYKSFNSFDAACDTPNVYLFGTFSGPVFSFLMMYVGAYLLRNGEGDERKHLGFALIFAQIPWARLTGPLFHQNDEWWAVIHLWGRSDFNWWVTLITIWVICAPPLIVAYKAIQNRYAWLWLFFFIIFPIILVGPFFFTLEYLMLEKGVLSQTILGIGFLFLLNEIVTLAGHFLTKKWINPWHASES